MSFFDLVSKRIRIILKKFTLLGLDFVRSSTDDWLARPAILFLGPPAKTILMLKSLKQNEMFLQSHWPAMS